MRLRFPEILTTVGLQLYLRFFYRFKDTRKGYKESPHIKLHVQCTVHVNIHRQQINIIDYGLPVNYNLPVDQIVQCIMFIGLLEHPCYITNTLSAQRYRQRFNATP